MGMRQFRLVLSLGAGLILLVESAAAQNTSSQALSADIRQPGDDTVRLAEPQDAVDTESTDSLAWYMKGIEAQKNNDFSAAIEAFRQAQSADPSAAAPVRAEALLLMRSRQMQQVLQGRAKARRAIQLDLDDFRTQLQLASSLLSQPSPRNVNEAVNLLDSALKSDRIKPTDGEFILIHGLRGRVLLQLGRQAEAADSFEVLLQTLERPEDFELDFRQHQNLIADNMTGYEAVGGAMLAVGRLDKAIRAFEALVRIRQNMPGRHHLLLATALFRADELERAEETINTYFESGRREKESLELLARLYSSTARSSHIIDRLKELAANTGDASTVNLFLADTQLQQGQIEAAVESYQRVVLDTGDSAAFLGLIRVDILTANPKSFVSTLHKAIRARIEISEIAPFLPEIINDREFAGEVVDTCLKTYEAGPEGVVPEVTWLCAQIAHQIEADDERGRLLQATLDLNPGQRIGLVALDQLGVYHLMNERYTESAALFRRLLSIAGLSERQRPIVLLRLAVAESLRGHHDEALEAIQAALKLRPRDPELTFRLGWVYYQADDMAAAEEALESAISLSADVRDVQNSIRMQLGLVYSRSGRWDDSIQQYTAVIENSTQDEETHRRARLMLSAVYVEKGDLPESARILEVLYEEQSDDPGVNNDLGYLYADQNKNLEKALQMIELAVEADPENRAYLDSLGWVLYRLEKFEEALDALQKANSDPNFQDATLQEHLGDVYEALGRHEEARAAWKKALSTEESSDRSDPAVMERLRTQLGQPADDAAERETQPEPEAAPAEENVNADDS